MNKRGTGVIFILIAALLYCTKFISAAIFGSGVSSWSPNLYSAMLSYIGNSLNIWSIIAIVIGIFYLIWEEKSKIIK
ncbi:MAG: hypothetical protein FH761_18925 [Firmicutes bacterium]|nr:hypothetical protein [Bacillota bacterium]